MQQSTPHGGSSGAAALPTRPPLLPILALLVGLASPPDAGAQSVSIGAVGGVGWASADIETFTATQPEGRSAASGGILGTVTLSENYALRLGVLWAPRTFEFAEQGNFIFTVAQDYVDVPVEVQVSFPLESLPQLRPYGIGGLFYAHRLSCAHDSEFNGGIDSTDCSSGGQPAGATEALETRSWMAGWVLGGGAALSIGPGEVLLEGRLTPGLTNVNANEQQSAMKLGRRMVHAGFLLPLGGRP